MDSSLAAFIGCCCILLAGNSQDVGNGRETDTAPSITADAEKVRQTAQREIEGAMKAARTELRAFVAEQSVGLAETIIRREIRPDDNTRMLNKYIDELHEVSK